MAITKSNPYSRKLSKKPQKGLFFIIFDIIMFAIYVAIILRMFTRLLNRPGKTLRTINNVDNTVLLSINKTTEIIYLCSVMNRRKSFHYLLTNVCRTRSDLMKIVLERLNSLSNFDRFIYKHSLTSF